jgi:hypothetical protein
MKTKLNILFLATISIAVSMIGCDKIEPPYRETTTQSGFVANDSTIIIGSDTIIFDYDTTSNVKRVLVEDYTGHLCGNCPYAGLFLNDTLKPLFGDRLVVMSVHAGWFAYACPHTGASPCPGVSAPAGSFATDFINSTSTAWDTKFGNSSAGNPNGMIDRIDYPSDNVKYTGTWQANIQSQLSKSCDFKIRIINIYDSATRSMNSAVQVKSLINSSDSLKLQVVLTEDSIKDWQEWYSHTPQFDSLYIHHHVMRGAINSDFGQTLSNSTIVPGSIFMNGYTFTINSNYVATKCKVVVFIYNASTYEIIQAAEEDVEN